MRIWEDDAFDIPCTSGKLNDFDNKQRTIADVGIADVCLQTTLAVTTSAQVNSIYFLKDIAALITRTRAPTV